MSDSEDDLAHNIAVQEDRFVRIKQTLINFKKDSVTRKTKTYLSERLKRANELYEHFRKTHDELIAAGIQSDNDYMRQNKYMLFEELFLELHCALMDKQEELFPEKSVACSANQTNVADLNHTIRTKPAIQFENIPTPIFSGKFIDWPSFHDSFDQLIHKSPELANVQKFHYLKKALPSDRDTDIQNMFMTEENYLIAWELINKRYNNPRILFSHHMNALYALPVLKAETSNEIKAMLNAASVCINEFHRLNIPIRTCDHWIVHYLSTKLPNETLKAWERHLGNDSSIPTFKTFEDFLINRLFTIDAMEHRLPASPITSNPKAEGRPQNKSKSRSASTHSFHLQTHNQHKGCILCSQNHILRRCPRFLSTDCFARKGIVDQHRICLNCLSDGHTVTKCTSSKNCSLCGQRHHSLLHFPRSSSDMNSNSPDTVVPTSTNTPSGHCIPPVPDSSFPATRELNRIQNAHTSVFISNQTLSTASAPTKPPVLLATAMIILRNPDTHQCGTFCALIDQGSEGTIISEHVAQCLRLPRSKSFADIHGVGENSAHKSKGVVSCILQSKTQTQVNIFLETVHVLPRLNIYLPSERVEPQVWPHLQNLELADPTYYRLKRIDIIIGADIYPSIILPDIKLGERSQPMAQNTKLGWVLSGNTSPVSNSLHCSTKIHCNVSLVELDTLVKRFYASEEVTDETALSAQDQWCENFFQKTHVRQPDGRYLVRLPLKTHYDPTQTIGRSKQTALNRFLHLERRLQRNSTLWKQYTEAITDYFTLRQITPAISRTEDSRNLTSCVLPHHAVFKEENSTTKIRIVFDASAATSNGRSLNDILCIGPPLQNNLAAVLLNWRIHRFVFIADIQKMYRCINMHPEDSQYQRILWRDKMGHIREYCLTTVTFGTASAPYTAIRVLHQLAQDENQRFPLASDILRHEIYVDDVLSGSDTIPKAIQMRDQLIGALRSAGMELRKWSSNTPKLLESIPVTHQSLNLNFTLNERDTVKTLGLNWNPETDQLTFEARFEVPTVMTKRTVLSTIARLFDPLGLITPVIISAKLILKEVWAMKVTNAESSRALHWDEELPMQLAKKWQRFVNEMNTMGHIHIPRWVNVLSTSEAFEIHAFCDGSSTSYAAAVYLRVQQQNSIHSHLIVAKSKVTPTKSLTIPRVELCGAVLSVTLTNWVRKHLRGVKNNVPVFYWTDASIVLFWIYGEPSRWQTYVCNRVTQILDLSSPEQWGHVGTTENPADCATRGLTPTQLANFSLWWHGPSWLCQSKRLWPKFLCENLIINEAEKEEKRTTVRSHVCIPSDSIIFRYSSFNRTIRITAWLFRFYHNCKQLPCGQGQSLTVNELQSSLLRLIVLVQQETFGAEISALNRHRSLPTNSKLNSLVPFLDDNAILRVRGRLANSNLPWSQRHPIILPSSHHFTNLVIDHEHLQTLHGGIQLTLAKIRQRFWIMNARRMVRNRLRHCIRCFRQNPAVVTQLMGDLPSERVNPPTRPFIATGVDYTGAIVLKSSRYRGNTKYKGYIAIFICLATKAIHLEAVTGLTTQHFIWALQRFIGRRGLCKDMYSDCGTNFVGASKLLQTNYFSPDEVANKLATQGIQWHFSPPRSPTFGGLWEANVKSTKHHLKRTIGENCLTYEELSTVLVRIEACLNSRPLCPLTTDPDDLEVLTPAHFLITESLLSCPDIQQRRGTSSTELTTQFFELQRKVHSFWSRWSTDWLSHLQARPKWRHVEPNLQVGELVVVKEDNLPPNQWMLGRIMEVHPGQDKLVRVVTVRTRTGLFKRSVSKICRLPMPNISN